MNPAEICYAAGWILKSRSFWYVAMQPLYTPDNTTTAYQLNWSVALFGTDEFPPADKWLSELKVVAESDGVRILEHHIAAANVIQFLVSSKRTSLRRR